MAPAGGRGRWRLAPLAAAPSAKGFQGSGGRGRGAQGADSPSAAADKFFKQNSAPEPYLGPVFTVVAPGRGHGLGAAKTLNAGDLLLVSPPLAAVSAEDFESAAEEVDEGEGEDVMDLKFEALQQKLLSRKYSPAEVSWFNALTPAMDTSASDEPSPSPSPPAQSDAKGVAAGGRGQKGAAGAAARGQEREAAAGADGAGVGSGFGAGGSGSGSGRFQAGPVPSLDTLLTSRPKQGEQTLPCPADADHVEGLIQANAYEAASEDTDLAYVALGREPVQEVMGLWPHYALLNHSCMPNTITYTHKGMLITRASRGSTSKGAELTANYIGDLLNTPLDVRREALEDTYGFVCSCTRCKEEERVGKDLTTLITDIYESCTEQAREELEDAIEDDDTAAIQGLRDQLTAFVEVLDAAFIKKDLPDLTQIWLQTSLFEVYELLNTSLEALGQQDMRLLELLQALAGETQPGSDLHCFYSRRLLQAQQEAEADSSDASSTSALPATMALPTASGVKHAEGLCYRAYTARYGPISRKVFLNILQTRQLLEEEEDEDEDE